MHFSRDALQGIWYTKHTVSVLPLKIIFVTEITKLSINLLSGQWIEQRTICYSRPRWLFICDLIEERAPVLRRAEQLALSPIRCKLELWGVPGVDAKGFSLWARAELAQGQTLWAVSNMLLLHLSCTAWEGQVCAAVVALPVSLLHRWVLCSKAPRAACTSWFTFVIVTLTSSWAQPRSCLNFQSAKPIYGMEIRRCSSVSKAAFWIGFCMRTFDGEPWPWPNHVV